MPFGLPRPPLPKLPGFDPLTQIFGDRPVRQDPPKQTGSDQAAVGLHTSPVPEASDGLPSPSVERRRWKKQKLPAGELGIVLKRRTPNPAWLREYQERMKIAGSRAAEETRHLTGVARQRAETALSGKYMKELK